MSLSIQNRCPYQTQRFNSCCASSTSLSLRSSQNLPPLYFPEYDCYENDQPTTLYILLVTIKKSPSTVQDIAQSVGTLSSRDASGSSHVPATLRYSTSTSVSFMWPARHTCSGSRISCSVISRLRWNYSTRTGNSSFHGRSQLTVDLLVATCA